MFTTVFTRACHWSFQPISRSCVTSCNKFVVNGKELLALCLSQIGRSPKVTSFQILHFFKHYSSTSRYYKLNALKTEQTCKLCGFNILISQDGICLQSYFSCYHKLMSNTWKQSFQWVALVFQSVQVRGSYKSPEQKVNNFNM